MNEIDYKYIFKYNESGDLYNYVEINDDKQVLSYYFLTANTLVRYDKQNNTKSFTKYNADEEVVMLQRFEANESWVTISVNPKIKPKKDDENETFYRFPQYYHSIKQNHSTKSPEEKFTKFPKKTKEIILNNNNIVNFKITNENIKKWHSCISSDILCEVGMFCVDKVKRVDVKNHLFFKDF